MKPAHPGRRGPPTSGGRRDLFVHAVAEVVVGVRIVTDRDDDQPSPPTISPPRFPADVDIPTPGGVITRLANDAIRAAGRRRTTVTTHDAVVVIPGIMGTALRDRARPAAGVGADGAAGGTPGPGGAAASTRSP